MFQEEHKFLTTIRHSMNTIQQCVYGFPRQISIVTCGQSFVLLFPNWTNVTVQTYFNTPNSHFDSGVHIGIEKLEGGVIEIILRYLDCLRSRFYLYKLELIRCYKKRSIVSKWFVFRYLNWLRLFLFNLWEPYVVIDKCYIKET